MAVEDDPKFEKWKKAHDNLRLRTDFYNAVVSKYPPTHPLFDDVTQKLAAARDEYEKVVSEL